MKYILFFVVALCMCGCKCVDYGSGDNARMPPAVIEDSFSTIIEYDTTPNSDIAVTIIADFKRDLCFVVLSRCSSRTCYKDDIEEINCSSIGPAEAFAVDTAP